MSTTPRPQELVMLSKAERMLAQAQSIDEILRIENLADQARNYAKKAGMGRVVCNQAAKVMLDARRKAGGTLKAMKERGELAERGDAKKSQPATFRIEDLGLTKSQSSRYQQEASVPEKKYEEYLLQGLNGGDCDLTAAGLRKLGKRHRKVWAERTDAIEGVCTSLQALIDEGKRFQCIYADPPWAYSNQETRASTDNHYRTMSVEQIAAEPVKQLAADNAHLHLWATNAFWFEAREIMEAWGFEYRSCFVWVKPQLGIGNYWRLSHEFLLLGIRGEATNFLVSDERSWLESNRTRHSQKPAAVRAKIERVSPGPYLEMYGRERIPGWTVYGDQISPQKRLGL